mgnify:CR=1 FL=1
MIHGQQYKPLYGESQMGSTPMQALLMATRDAARGLGKEKDLGTIEPGKEADLVLLNRELSVNQTIRGGVVVWSHAH